VHHTEATFQGMDGVSLFFQSWSRSPSKSSMESRPGLPADQPKASLVIVHGVAEHSDRYTNLVEGLVPRGYALYAYDQRGHGESSPAAVSLGPLEAADVGEALRMLAERELGERSVVWGVSMGAATALLAAARFAQIQGVIAESSFERLDHVLADTVRLRFHVPSFPIVPLVLAAASLLCKHNLFRVHIGDAVAALGDRPLLLVSGAEDRRMTPEHGRRLLARSSGPTEHLVIAGADHAQCWPLGKAVYSESALKLLETATVVGRALAG